MLIKKMNLSPRKTVKLCFLLLGVTLCAGFFLFGQADQISAQEAETLDWSYPAQIPQYHKEGRPPVLVADKNNQIHGFTVDTNPDGGSAIVYRRWTEKVGWEIPVDIILPPRAGTAKILGVEIDQDDYLHIVAFYGDIFGAGLYHMTAPLANAKVGLAWSEPALIADSSGPLAEGMLVGDGKETLHVVYQGGRVGLGLYEVTSVDGGLTWSEPSTIYLSSTENALPSAVDVFLDDDGMMHAVWSIWNATLGVGDELFYSQKARGSSSWTIPTLIANRTGREYESDWGAITASGDELLILYQDSFPAAKFMRRSTDGGLTWTNPERPWPHIGEYENAVFMKDSIGRLHTILGNRDGDCCHGMWHSVYLDGNWEPLEPLIFGPKTIDFDPSAPDAVISQGNLIMATWWMDSPDRNGAWYSYAKINDVEPIAAQPIQPPKPVAGEDDVAVEELFEDETREVVTLPDDWKIEEASAPVSSAMLLGIATAIFAILISLLVWQFFIRNR